MRYRSLSGYSQLLIAHVLSKIIFMKYLPAVRSKMSPKLRMLRIYGNLATCNISSMLISILMSKIIFKEYLPPVRPKLFPNLKMLKIYWNLANLIFQTSWSRFRCQRLFLWNIYHLFGPNWSQNQKYLEFNEIWHISYFVYPDLEFDVNIYFH